MVEIDRLSESEDSPDVGTISEKIDKTNEEPTAARDKAAESGGVVTRRTL